MSTTMTSTTSLAQSQRKRLLKSSRKIESVLGATPLVLEIDVGGSFDLNASSKSAARPPITPRTRAHRRRGQVFSGSSSSCSESSDESSSDCNSQTTLLDFRTVGDLEDDASDSDASSFVFVSTMTPRAIYQPQQTPAAPPTTSKDVKSRKRSKSEAASKSKLRSPSPALPPLPPMPMLKGSKSTTSRVQPLAQPILFRLRSVPVSSPPSHSRTVSESPSTTSTITSPSKHAKSASDDLRSPLSPLFDPARASLVSIPESDAVREAKERELRRKRLAKVARTLGENVPPELVFGSTSSSSSPLKSKPADSIGRQTPLPARKNVSASSTAAATPAISKGRRKHRPRSLSMPIAYAQVAVMSNTKGTIIIEQDDLEAETPKADHAIPSVTLTSPTGVSVLTPPPPKVTPRARSHSKSQSHSAIVPPTSSTSSRNSPYGYGREGYYSSQDVGTISRADSPAAYRPRAERNPAFASLIGRHAGASASSSALACYPQAVVTEGGYMTGTASLDMQRPVVDGYVYGKQVSREVTGLMREKEEEDWGKRKEREWSGEWNVRDMDDVKRKLRELKGR